MKLYASKLKGGRRSGERGYMLLVILLFLTLLIIGALATGPSIVGQIRRDQEMELVNRGAQYARAVKKFYKKFGRYPVSLEQLENTNQLRFLRKRYKDPITRQDFKILRFGDVQIGPKSGGGVGASASSLAAQSQRGSQTGGERTGTPSGASEQSSSSSPSSSQTGLFGSSKDSKTGPIIGVASTSEKESLMEFDDKNHYNEWNFVYDPAIDRGGLIKGPYSSAQATGGSAPQVGTPAGSLSAPGTGTSGSTQQQSTSPTQK